MADDREVVMEDWTRALIMGIVTFLITSRTLVISPGNLEPKVPGSPLIQFTPPSG